jgi:predicted O-methyltransferase YrrM
MCPNNNIIKKRVLKVGTDKLMKYISNSECSSKYSHFRRFTVILFRAVRYLKYMLLSRHRKGHGIHSPFVFDLVSRIFRNKIDHDIVCSIEKVRKSLISDRRSIYVRDLGSGKGSLKTSFRKVSDIAKYSPVPFKYGVLLSNMAAEFGRPFIVEFGTSFGISTMYMAASCTDATVFTMEGCPAISEIANQNFKTAGLNNIKLLTGAFDEILPEITNHGKKPGLIFIDGNHRREPVLSYFRKMAEISDSRTVIIIDDISFSKEMAEAWNEIKGFENVTLTVDIFRMGIVFFREGLNHKNYIIRY